MHAGYGQGNTLGGEPPYVLVPPRTHQASGISTTTIRSAAHVELGAAVRVECAPVLLVRRSSILANGIRFAWLVKRLKVEDVDAPVEHATYALIPELRGIRGVGYGGAVVRAAVWGFGQYLLAGKEGE
jgi:hypothetical protein